MEIIYRNQRLSRFLALIVSVCVIMSAGDTHTGQRRRAPPPPVSPVKTSSQQGYDELKLKYLTVDRNYETLKQLTRKGE